MDETAKCEITGTDLHTAPGYCNHPEPQGRACTACDKIKLWSEYALKPKGINGRDSRCRNCVSTAKQVTRRRRKIKLAELRNQSRRKTTVLDFAACEIIRVYLGDRSADDEAMRALADALFR